MSSSLREKQGTTIRAAIKLKATDTLIAEKGETIGNQHVTRVQKAVKERLDEIESQLKEAHNNKLAELDQQVEIVKAEADQKVSELRNSIDEEGVSAREDMIKDRDELSTIQQMMFLGESRYREAQSKMGSGLSRRYGRRSLL